MDRLKLEKQLEDVLIGQQVVYTRFNNKSVTDRVRRLAVNIVDTVPVITLMFNISNIRYECDLEYLCDNLKIIYGDTYRGDRRNLGRILKENQQSC